MMPLSPRIGTFVLAVAAVFLSLSPARAGDTEWLPLAKGNYWVYRGPTKWTESGDKVKEATLTWRMEITEVIHSDGGVTAAVVKGAPNDLAWYEPGKKPGDWLIVRLGLGQYYLYDGSEAAEKLALIRKGHARPKALANEDDLFISAPLTAGKHYGPADQLHRSMYCWVVLAAEPFSGKEIAGFPRPEVPRKVYPVTFRTNPDRMDMGVVPDVGIVSYRYVHHGTVSETDLKLVEVHLEKP